MKPANRDFDVAVIGAGPAGSLAARELARRGRRVLLLDRVTPALASGRLKIGESLPAAAKPLLSKLGLFHLLENGVHLPSFGNCFFWGSDQPEHTDFIRDPNGNGWHLDRARFEADLFKEAVESGACWSEANIQGIRASKDGWILQESQSESRVRWIVDATGRSAFVARTLGVARRRYEKLSALFFWQEELRERPDGRTWVEATPEGWWYTSSIPGRKRIVSFHARPELARELARSPGLILEKLEGTRLAESGLVSAQWNGRWNETPRICDAGSARLDSFAGDGWIAAGDAALSFDPLSSQGLFNALQCGYAAARALDTCLTGGDGRAVLSYSSMLEQVWEIYRRRRRLFYSAESRWAKSPFWLAQSA